MSVGVTYKIHYNSLKQKNYLLFFFKVLSFFGTMLIFIIIQSILYFSTFLFLYFSTFPPIFYCFISKVSYFSMFIFLVILELFVILYV